ncbi:MAG: hypothetical protein EOO03_10970 [Chitinophagaceae bacterium]|nr:MAG: hypothetical protein EOO03_10970 [Chitinophagaceae bacterium]
MAEKFRLPADFHQISPADFNKSALELFRYQATENAVYRSFLFHLNIHPESVTSTDKIPFLPISFFKTHIIKSGEFEHEKVFKSSGTAAQGRSAHFVKDLGFYRQHSIRIFEQQYGKLTDYIILALLPSYIVQGDSSLVYMVEQFIEATANPMSGFFLQQPGDMSFAIQHAAESGKKVLVIGVTYALLDLVESEDLPQVPNLVVMETGGMKGRRKELVRAEVHEKLCKGFKVAKIHSEYGMTELLSQSYSAGEGLFLPSAAMRILLRDVNDPLHVTQNPGRGGINVIDLANYDSCAFIETQDLGQLHEDGSFEVLGSSRTKTVDVRVVSATNRNLADMVAAGSFREDLLYRINLITLELPPLRERPGDIPKLVAFFISNLKTIYKRPSLVVTPEAMKWLRMPQPSNISLSDSFGHSGSLDLSVDTAGNSYWLCAITPGIYADGAFVNTLPGSNIFVFKYNALGNFQAAVPLQIAATGPSIINFKMTRDQSNGNFYIAGVVDHNPNSTDQLMLGGQSVTHRMYVAAFNASGMFLWKKENANTYNFDGMKDICLDSQGNIYVTGGTGISDSFNGIRQWNNYPSVGNMFRYA